MELIDIYKQYLIDRHVNNIDEKIQEFIFFSKCKFRNKYLSDELKDFCDILLERKTRWDALTKFIEKNYDKSNYKKVLDIECNNNIDFALLLQQKGYDVTIVNSGSNELHLLKTIRKSFDYKLFDVSKYNLLVGLNAGMKTEHILRSAVTNNKPFVIVLDNQLYSTLTCENIYTTAAWNSYLNNVYPNETKIVEEVIYGKTLKLIKNK